MAALSEYAGAPYAGSSSAATPAAPVSQVWPTLSLWIAPGYGPQETPAWTDITERIRNRTPLRTRRGRTHALDEVTAGTFTCELDNTDRALDPSYTSGTWYASLGPNIPIQLRATWDTNTYILWTGLIDSLEQRYEKADNDATVFVRASDLFRLLAHRDYRPKNVWTLDRTDGSSRLDDDRHLADDLPSIVRERTGARIGRILHTLGFSSSQMTLEAGGSILHADPPTDSTALAYILRAARTELGRFFVGADGVLTFHDRHHHRSSVTAITSQLTLGDTQSHTVRYSDLVLDPADERNLINHARCGRDGKKPAVARDLSSIDLRGEQKTDREDLLFADMLEAADQARFLVGRYASPQARIERVVLQPRRFGDALWPEALGFDLGTRVTVERTPLDLGNVFSQECFVEMVEHQIDLNRRDWVTSWSLAPADTTVYWRLDQTDGTSRLDDGMLLGY